MILRLAVAIFVIATAFTSASAQTGPVTPVAECMTVSDQMVTVRFGYRSQNDGIVDRLVTPENNIFVGGNISPSVGQPTTFTPGAAHDVFRATFDFSEAPVYMWVLDATVLRIDNNVPLCRDRDQRQIVGMLECVQPPTPADSFASARFAYVNLGDMLSLPQRSSRNYFGRANALFEAQSNRGQPTLFAPGLNRGAFTVRFDPSTEPLIIWQIDGESVPAAVGMPNVPTCVALDTIFASGFESDVFRPLQSRFALRAHGSSDAVASMAAAELALLASR